MNSLAFVTHPSVRIKGTENSYSPSQCLDERCPVKAPHMHCPFCVKTDAYQDPVILKAHYRVKHVDKGIEFAGLKILRCCDHCDIVGIIKGEKRFKGAHWHCYRCRNGFNRRDEAIKHYKTHFRNPQTTFQIQITQDLNSPPGVKPLEDPSNLRQEVFASTENPVQEIIHPALTQAAMSLSEHNDITSDASKYPKVHVKEERLLKEISAINAEEEQTIMIIQGDQLQSGFTSHVINSAGEVCVLNKGSMDSNISWEIRFRIEEEAKKLYKSQAEEYKNQVELLQQRVTELESQLSQNNDLKVQDLLSSLSVGDPDKQLLAQQISKYLEEVEASEAETSDSAMAATSHHIVTAEGMVHSFKLQPSTTLAQELEAGNADTDINSMSDSYQVISQVVDSHRVLLNHTGEPTIHVKEVSSSTLHSDLDGKSVEAVVDSQSVPQQDMFTSVEQVSHGEELLVSEVLASSVDHVSAAQSLMESASNLSREEQHTVLNIGGSQEEGLLQVVAAADGLASLGTDVTVVAASDNPESTRTFIMEVEGGQQLLVQREEEDGSLQPLAVETSSSESKRPRLS